MFRVTLMIIVLLLLPSLSRADVSLIVAEALGVAGEYSASGHTAVYLSNICADGVERLRMCGPGEPGVVLSSYPGLVQGHTYEWIPVPLSGYLYGVSDPAQMPLYANGEIRELLRETYRIKYLDSAVPSGPDGRPPTGKWGAMVANAFNRDVYSFTVITSHQEDLQFVENFNKRPNSSKFNVLCHNCADFARQTLNLYFPGSIRRDWINDFGIMTPKTVARRFTNRLGGSPNRLFHVRRYPQIAGSIERSYDTRNLNEMLFKSRKYVIPFLFFKPELIAVFAGSYFFTGEFDVQRTHKKTPTPEIARLRQEKLSIQRNRSFLRSGKERSKEIDREIALLLGVEGGTDEIWNAHKREFAGFIKTAIARRLFQNDKELGSFFRDLELQSVPAFDDQDNVMLKVDYYGSERLVGLTINNILAQFSDPEIALKLLMAKINYDLKAKAKDRSLYPDFARNWAMMRYLLQKEPSIFASIDAKRGPFLVNKDSVSAKRKLKKFVRTVTR